MPIYKALAITLCFLFMLTEAQAQNQTVANPLIWADVPDPSVVRVGDKYYMASTTMHMSPGVPIMESSDLVRWRLVSYCHNALVENDELNMTNGRNAYGRGSWAPSIRFRNGTFFVVTFSYSSGRTHIYRTQDVVNGPWVANTLPTAYHDPALFFEDDGRPFLIYGDNEIRIIELNSDLTALRSGGVNQILISNASSVAGTNFYVRAEGSHLHKVDGMYYLFLISWPNPGQRSQLVWRSASLTGTYEGRVVLQDQGVAQGGIFTTPQGVWYAMLFQDAGAVGRIPYLVPVQWQNGWPVFGVNGRVPGTLTMPAAAPADMGIVNSDDFSGPRLVKEWQWNHNPDNNHWSISARAGFLRLSDGRVDTGGFLATRNTLTQRAFGPQSVGEVAMEVAGMRDGDFAGLGALQRNFGFVGVKMVGSTRSIIMVNGASETPTEVASIPLNQNRVFLRINKDFRNRIDRATFAYSLDGNSWTSIGNTLQMSYTLPHFMGYRFALFSYGTRSTGGYADFDYFRIGTNAQTPIFLSSATQVSSSSNLSSSSSSSISEVRAPFAGVIDLPATIQGENYDRGGQGVAFNDSDPENLGNVYRTDAVDITGSVAEGFKIGWTMAGEWLEYTVRLNVAGPMAWEARVSSGLDGAGFRMSLDGVDISDSILVPNTGSWDTYTTITGRTTALTTGQKILRIRVTGSFFNLDWIRFHRDDPTGIGRVLPEAGVTKIRHHSLFDLNGRRLQNP